MKDTINSQLKYIQLDSMTERFIATSYNQPHRKYHGWSHIKRLLELLHTVGEQRFDLTSEDLEWLEKAILSHDIVYIPGHKYNEEESAEIAVRLFPDTPALFVAIDATRHHTNPDNKYLPYRAKVLLDLDLWDLATDRYKNNGVAIQWEFQPFVTVTRDFMLGRKKWLESMLDADQIFWIATELEEAARANLQNDLNTLKETLKFL